MLKTISFKDMMDDENGLKYSLSLKKKKEK